MTASWKLSPTERKRKPRELTTGKTASDSTGKAARPMKKVSIGWMAMPTSEVSAKGT